MISMDKDYVRDNDFYQLAEELEERDLTYGYATFWNASTVTMASDSAVKVRNILIENDVIVPYQYQSMNYWFDDQDDHQEYFVALEYDEYYKIADTDYWYHLMSEKFVEQFDCGNYRVTVFDSNIFIYDWYFTKGRAKEQILGSVFCIKAVPLIDDKMIRDILIL